MKEVGLLIGVIGVFLSFYDFTAKSANDNFLSEWKYYILVGVIGDSIYAPNIVFSLEVSVFYIILLTASVILIFFKKRDFAKVIAPYLNGAVVVAQGLLIVGFPLTFLILNRLYFPILSILQGDTVLSFALGPGYYLTIGSFILVFPEAVSSVYYKSLGVDDSKNRENASEIPESIDIDREIAVEKAELNNIQLEKSNFAKRR